MGGGLYMMTDKKAVGTQRQTVSWKMSTEITNEMIKLIQRAKMWLNDDDKNQQSSQLKSADHITSSSSLSIPLCGLTCKWYSIIKPEGRGPNDSSDLSHTFCISSQAQLGMMSPNPTHTSPKHVRQGITTIQLGRYGQISPCDWILCRKRSSWVGCEDREYVIYKSVRACFCLFGVRVHVCVWSSAACALAGSVATTQQCPCNVSDEWPTALAAQKPSLKSRVSLSVSNALRVRRCCLRARVHLQACFL